MSNTPDFKDQSRLVVLKMNEIRPEQWDECDDGDQKHVIQAMSSAYQAGRVAGLMEAKWGIDIVMTDGPRKDSLMRWVDDSVARIEREQAVHGKGGK